MIGQGRSALQRRLTIALSLTALLSSALVGFALWVGDHWLEDPAVQDLMTRTAERLQASSEPGGTGQSLQLYGGAHGAPPASLSALAPGFHQYVPHDGDDFYVVVRADAGGDRLWLAYDASFIEQRERILEISAAVVAVLITGFGLVLARYLATRTLAPLARLVRDLRALDPEGKAARLDENIADDELRSIAQAINRYTARLDDLVERERAFGAAASHELRTPLAVLRGGTETLRLQNGSPALDRMDRAARDMGDLLDALLALSRLREPPPAESLALERLLPELAEREAGAATGSLSWEIQGPASLQAPRGAVAIVFGNLLRNALRAARGGAIVIRIGSTEVTIADSGPGIAHEDLPHVFEPRFRGTDGGSGMGLYIAQTLAQRLGWRLSLTNRPQGGVVACWSFGRGPAP